MTENKRRYRARQKEYVADLERRLAESRAQEIKATTEVQLAARKVVAENGRLRELLQLAGFAREEIDVWAKRGDCQGEAGAADLAPRLVEIEQKARLSAAFSTGHKGALAAEGGRTCSPRRESNHRKREVVGVAGHMPERVDAPSSSQEPLVEPGSSHNSPSSDDAATVQVACSAPAPSEAPAATHAEETVASRDGQVAGRPCKLLSLLAENPAADLTQVQVPAARPSSADDPLQDQTAQGREEGDVECGRAYEMLMRYATSEEKMDRVARALEAGCVSTGQHGGCAVKKKAIWEALDGMCG